MEKVHLSKIKQLKRLVEAKAKLHSGEPLKQRDFETLIGLIYNETRINLSLSTLKRLWKSDYSGTPHPSTLDALSRFAGYANWHAFYTSDESQPPPGKAVEGKIDGEQLFKSLSHTPKTGIIITSSAFAIILLMVLIMHRREPVISFKQHNIVTDTLPARVIFEVEIKGILKDSLFIIATQRPETRLSIGNGAENAEFIYNTPGYYDVYLEYANRVTDSARVMVKTEGWIAAVYSYNSRKGSNIESFFTEDELLDQGTLHIAKESLEEREISVDGNLFSLFYLVSDTFNMDYDNFILETRVKSDSIYNFPSPYFYVSLVTRNGLEFIPFFHMKPDREHAISFSDTFLEGQTNDLSPLVTHLYKWNDIRIENHNKNITVFINGKESLNFSYKSPLEPIYGFNFTFLGTGSVERVVLKDTLMNTVY